jgi:hypothetical protein
MNHRDNLNRLLLPNITDNIRIEIPEAVPAVQQFFMKVSNSGRLTQASQFFIKSGSKALSGIGTIRCDIQEDLLEVGFGLRRKPKAPLHA